MHGSIEKYLKGMFSIRLTKSQKAAEMIDWVEMKRKKERRCVPEWQVVPFTARLNVMSVNEIF